MNLIASMPIIMPFPSKTFPKRKDAFETLGFKFGEEINEYLMEATLPVGWSKEDHLDAFSDIYDDRKRRRVQIDVVITPSATDVAAVLLTRYTVDSIQYKGKVRYVVLDRGNPQRSREIFTTPAVDAKSVFKMPDVPAAACDWLAERFPDHRNHLSYWNET